MKLFRLIVDYVDKRGRNYFQPLITVDPMDRGLDTAIERIKHTLKENNCKLIAITEVFDDTADIQKLCRIAQYPTDVEMKVHVFDRSALNLKNCNRSQI